MLKVEWSESLMEVGAIVVVEVNKDRLIDKRSQNGLIININNWSA